MKTIALIIVFIAFCVPALGQRQDERSAASNAASQSYERTPSGVEPEHVRLSTPVVKAWRNLELESPVYMLGDLVAAKDWLEHALIQRVPFQFGPWNISLEPEYSVFRIYPYMSKGSPQPSVFQGIVLKVNGDLSVDDLITAIRNRTPTVKIDEYDIFGADGVGLQKYSRRHGGAPFWPGGESNEALPPANSLSLTISMESPKQFYGFKEKLQVETRLKNVGTGDLYLFDDVCWNPGNLLNIHVFNMAGKEVSGKSDLLRDCLPAPPQRNDSSQFRLLAPGSDYTNTETFSLAELVPGPGEYDLRVHYHSGISRKWILEYGGEKMIALPIWTSQEPTLESNKLHIVVKR